MPPLTRERPETSEREGRLLVVPVAANAVIYNGALVVANAAGFATPASSAANLTALGRAEQSVNNTGGVAGALTIQVKRGVFKFDNDPADLVTQAELGKKVFCKDDQTVKKTGGAGFSEAGKVLSVDTDGVWIEVL
jgi:hypothetical protein